MPASVLGAGLLLGLSIAAPVGPMGLLCINRTLTRGLAGGLAIGAGIATGDAAYGAVAAFGFSAVTGFLVAYEVPLRIIGGLFLLWLGMQAWRAVGKPRRAREVGDAGGALASYAVAVGLTLTNPSTILSFIAAFGALGLATQSDGALVMVAGVFLGSAAWWLLLCGTVALARQAVTPRVMLWIDRLSAAFLLAFGAAAVLGLL
jgi:threonine/homoserine/homoserine lactone efflux protein